MTASAVVKKKRAVVAASVDSNQLILCGSSHRQVGEGLGTEEDFVHTSFTRRWRNSYTSDDYRGTVFHNY